MKNVTNVTYAYSIQLRGHDNDSFGFMLPANQSIDTGKEIYSGLKVIADEVIIRHNGSVEDDMQSLRNIATSLQASYIILSIAYVFTAKVLGDK